MSTSSKSRSLSRAVFTFFSCSVLATAIIWGTSLSYTFNTNELAFEVGGTDKALAAQCAPTPPVSTLPTKPPKRQAYMAANPSECWLPGKGVCWFEPCAMGATTEQLQSSLMQMLGQQVGQMLQQAMQGGGGGGGGGGGDYGAYDPNSYNYTQDAALNDLYNNLDLYNSSTTNLYDFFGPSTGTGSTTGTGSSIIDDFYGDSGNNDPDDPPDSGSYFCPNGDCSFIKDFQNPDAPNSNTGGNTSSGSGANTSGNTTAGGTGVSAGSAAVDNFSWSAEQATGQSSTRSPLGSMVQLITPGDPDRVVVADVATMLGLSTPGNRLTPEQLAARQRAIEEAIRAGQDTVAIQGEDGQTYYVGTDSYEAFNWQYPDGGVDYMAYLYFVRLLRILPFPVIGMEPYLF